MALSLIASKLCSFSSKLSVFSLLFEKASMRSLAYSATQWLKKSLA
ncbi:hypothetical protein KVJ87_04885 [Helicobacter pylori]|nr:hypothetical protein KVJ87_04885 [Helicobacter pylori]